MKINDEQIGIKEDISSLISTITPTDTPFSSMLKSEKVHNRVYQYQTDVISSGSGNAQLEGFVASAGTMVPTTMLSGNTQILQNTFQVSGSADAITAHARGKETAYQMSKALKHIKKDVEFAMIGASNAAVTGNATTAREMASCDQLIASGVTTAGGSAALTEAMITANHQALFVAGGDPSILMVKPSDSLVISAMTGAAGRSREFNDGNTTLTAVVNLLVSPFGELKVQINRHQMATHAFLLDPSMWRQMTLRPMTRTLLAKTGDSDTHMLVTEIGLAHKNPSGSGQINALT